MSRALWAWACCSAHYSMAMRWSGTSGSRMVLGWGGVCSVWRLEWRCRFGWTGRMRRLRRHFGVGCLVGGVPCGVSAGQERLRPRLLRGSYPALRVLCGHGLVGLRGWRRGCRSIWMMVSGLDVYDRLTPNKVFGGTYAARHVYCSHKHVWFVGIAESQGKCV
jgi:hypothetical protein